MTTGFRESAVGASCRNGVIFLTWEPLPRVRPNCGDVGASVSCVKAQEYNVGWYRVSTPLPAMPVGAFLMLEEELTNA